MRLLIDIPTDQPESDGTIKWDSDDDGHRRSNGRGNSRLGYSYAERQPRRLIESKLKEVEGTRCNGLPNGAWIAMVQIDPKSWSPRHLPRWRFPGSTTALWDLKAGLLGIPLVKLLGAGARSNADLRQRRIHFVQDRSCASNSAAGSRKALRA